MIVAKNDAADPACKLLSQSEEDRLCAVVMNSSYFRHSTSLQDPLKRESPVCVEIKVSFQSDEARKAAGGKTYQERAVPCWRKIQLKKHMIWEFFFISWAYASNELFVYEKDSKTRRVYVRNMTIGVDFVEAD